MTIECIIGIVGIIIGIVGIFLAYHYERGRTELYKKLRTITWDELRMASRGLRKKIEGKFQPDVIFTPCKRGATIANLMFDVDETIFLYVGTRIDRQEKRSASLPNGWEEGWGVVETKKYYNYIPKILLNLNKDIKLLIIDDFAMTGDSLEGIVDLLKKEGFKEENIKTATIVCTHSVYDGKHLPDFYWNKTEYKEFYFPWGKAV